MLHPFSDRVQLYGWSVIFLCHTYCKSVTFDSETIELGCLLQWLGWIPIVVTKVKVLLFAFWNIFQRLRKWGGGAYLWLFVVILKVYGWGFFLQKTKNVWRASISEIVNSTQTFHTQLIKWKAVLKNILSIGHISLIAETWPEACLKKHQMFLWKMYFCVCDDRCFLKSPSM